MFIKTAFLVSAGAGLMLVATPAQADNGRTPPGNPCARGNGNPCNGNGGNGGQQGNAGGPKTVTGPAPAISIDRPAIRDRGVYVTQIGHLHSATVQQSAPTTFARVVQSGERNRASVAQRGATIAYTDLRQSGMLNDATVVQRGAGGEAVLYATQVGDRNTLTSNQHSLGDEPNGAVLIQAGNDNQMGLVQAGSDNLAQLTQDGDRNQMTASQSGAGNRLVWTQQGNGLSNLAISQGGGQSLQVTQSR